MKSVSVLLVVVALVLAMSSSVAFADDSVPVYNLEQCISNALVSSNRLAISQQQVLSAQSGLNRAKGAFLPDLSFSRQSSSSQRTDFDYQAFAQGQPVGDPFDNDSESNYSSNSVNSNLVIFQGMNRFGALKSAENTTEITLGTIVRHKRFGVGKVQRVLRRERGSTVTIDFPSGTKHLVLEYANLEIVIPDSSRSQF